MLASTRQSGIARALKKIMDIPAVQWVATLIPKGGLTLKHAYKQHFLVACTILELRPFLTAQGMKTAWQERIWRRLGMKAKKQS